MQLDTNKGYSSRTNLKEVINCDILEYVTSSTYLNVYFSRNRIHLPLPVYSSINLDGRTNGLDGIV